MSFYPKPLGGVTRRLNQYTTIHSTKFSRFGKLNFGNRTAVIQIPDTNKLIIWSSIPVGRELQKVIDLATGEESNKFEVLAAIIPNIEHTMAAADLKHLFPKIFLIGPSGISGHQEFKLDYEFTDDVANKVISGSDILKELTNLDFVFLNGHRNRELVTFDKNTNLLFEADLLFNIPWNGENDDQYPLEKQTKGLQGWFTGVLNPNSRIGGYIFRSLIPKTNENSRGLGTILKEFDFDTVVLSHGNIIETNGKEEFRKVFRSYL